MKTSSNLSILSSRLSSPPSLLALSTMMAAACGPIVIGERPEDPTGGMGGEAPNVPSTGGWDAGSQSGVGGTASQPNASVGGSVSGSGNLPALPLPACEDELSLGRELVLLRSPVSSTVSSYEATDVNGDDLLDWVALTDGPIRAFLQRGDGGFAAPIESPSALGPGDSNGDFTTINAADFNGDGHVDLAVGYYRSSRLRIFQGHGDGRFEFGSEYSTEGQTSALRSADLNGDGLLDLAVVNSSGHSIQIFRGIGDGTFDYVSRISILSPGSIVVGDWNDDSFPDLAIGNFSQSLLTIMLGAGDFTFESSGAFEAGYNLSVADEADLNDDGVLDLVIVNGGSPSDYERVGVLLGQGDGKFDEPTWDNRAANAAFLIDSDADGALDAWIEVPQPIESYPFHVADWNGDGFADVAVLIQGGYAAYILHGKEDGSFQEDMSSSLEDRVAGHPLALADATGDGILDVLVPTKNNSVLIGEGAGDGTFRSAGEHPVQAEPQKVIAADLNNDGRMDLLTSNRDPAAVDASGASLSILISNEDSSYSRTDHPFEAAIIEVAVGDIDANGTLDLVGVLSPGGESNVVKILLGAGNGSFIQGVDQFLEHGASPQLRDFNGDAVLDLIVTSYSGATFMIGQGDGTFEPSGSISTQGLIALEDLNEDGFLDAVTMIAAEYNSPAWLAVALGNGEGSFGLERPQVPIFDYSITIVARDLDADGHIDLVLDNLILPGRGDGSFSCGEYRLLESGLIADLDGDGRNDVARVDPRSSSTRIEVFLGETLSFK